MIATLLSQTSNFKYHCKNHIREIYYLSTGREYNDKCSSYSYGDIVPRSIIGRSLAVIWMFCGILIAATITSTFTGAITGTSSLDIYKKNVRNAMYQ